ncbi:MAG: hypothetical protein PHT40_00875 [Patescibacteria group bacterium]|nr:hypothetical protein [Patescibacteria group bacterium]
MVNILIITIFILMAAYPALDLRGQKRTRWEEKIFQAIRKFGDKYLCWVDAFDPPSWHNQ